MSFYLAQCAQLVASPFPSLSRKRGDAAFEQLGVDDVGAGGIEVDGLWWAVGELDSV